VIALETDWD